MALRRKSRDNPRTNLISYARLLLLCKASAEGARSITGLTVADARTSLGGDPPHSPTRFNTRFPPMENPTRAIRDTRSSAISWLTTAARSPEKPEWYSVGVSFSVPPQLRIFIHTTFI